MKIHQHNLVEKKFPCFSLFGYSVAGEETVIVVPELDVSFDIGKCPLEALTVGHVLLTHGHFDHAFGLPYYFAQRHFQHQQTGVALVPKVIVDPLENLLECWSKIDGLLPPHHIIGMNPNEDYAINRKLIARTFATHHVVPSLGFSIIEVRQKLKPEFKHCSESELLQLKSRAINFTYTEEIPLIAYLGDTTFFDYQALPHVAKAKVLILECTFFRDDQKERSHLYKHLHVSDLHRLLANMENEHILITHVTRSVQLKEAKEIITKYLDSDVLSRVSFLM